MFEKIIKYIKKSRFDINKMYNPTVSVFTISIYAAEKAKLCVCLTSFESYT